MHWLCRSHCQIRRYCVVQRPWIQLSILVLESETVCSAKAPLRMSLLCWFYIDVVILGRDRKWLFLFKGHIFAYRGSNLIRSLLDDYYVLAVFAVGSWTRYIFLLFCKWIQINFSGHSFGRGLSAIRLVIISTGSREAPNVFWYQRSHMLSDIESASGTDTVLRDLFLQWVHLLRVVKWGRAWLGDVRSLLVRKTWFSGSVMSLRVVLSWSWLVQLLREYLVKRFTSHRVLKVICFQLLLRIAMRSRPQLSLWMKFPQLLAQSFSSLLPDLHTTKFMIKQDYLHRLQFHIKMEKEHLS